MPKITTDLPLKQLNRFNELAENKRMTPFKLAQELISAMLNRLSLKNIYARASAPTAFFESFTEPELEELLDEHDLHIQNKCYCAAIRSELRERSPK